MQTLRWILSFYVLQLLGGGGGEESGGGGVAGVPLHENRSSPTPAGNTAHCVSPTFCSHFYSSCGGWDLKFLMTKAQKEAPLYHPTPQRCTGLFVLQLTPFLPPLSSFFSERRKSSLYQSPDIHKFVFENVFCISRNSDNVFIFCIKYTIFS